MIKEIGKINPLIPEPYSIGGKLIKTPNDLLHGEIGIDESNGKAYIKIGNEYKEMALGFNISDIVGRLSIIKEIYKCQIHYIPSYKTPKTPKRERQIVLPVVHIVPPKADYVIDQQLTSGYTESVEIYNQWGIQKSGEIFWLKSNCGKIRRLCMNSILHPKGSVEANIHIERVRSMFKYYGITLLESDITYYHKKSR